MKKNAVLNVFDQKKDISTLSAVQFNKFASANVNDTYRIGPTSKFGKADRLALLMFIREIKV